MSAKVTFGIQPRHIEVIERIIKEQNDNLTIEYIENGVDFTFSKIIWQEIGRELGWDPFTICLAYFKHLKKNSTNAPPPH